MSLVACADDTSPGDIDPNQTITEPGNTEPGTTDPGNVDPANTDPGTVDPGNTDPTPATTGEVKLRVEYAGTKMGNLVVGLFTTYPPQGPPVAFDQLNNAGFPANVTLVDVPAGTYTALVVLDVAPYDPATPGPEDIMTPVTVTVPSTGAVPVVLVDTTEPTPEPVVSDVTMNVVYNGTQAGNLVVGLFDSWPPTGPPKFFTQQANAMFPATVVVKDVDEGTYTALVMLDAEPFDPGTAGPEDRMVTVQISPPLAGKITVTLTDDDAPVTDPTDPADPTDPTDPADPADPEDVSDPDPNGANFKVFFEGDNPTGNLVMAFFDMWPPMGPPAKVHQVQNVAFPAHAVVTDLAPGNYTVVVSLDREPFNPSSPGPEDVKVNVEINVPMGQVWEEVTLVDTFSGMHTFTVDYF